ncbi:MAG: hypothetical protein Q7T55_15970, partial [Solirubrobacteraceae bacterium]|nr:hypothetical protein [Solirubrobacteraceae bacterium]
SPSGSNVIAKNLEGIMTIFGDREVDVGILAHEAAHQLAVTMWASAAPASDSEYMAAINTAEPPVSEYGATTPGEDFAEAVRMYIEDPARLAKIAPLRFAAIENLPGFAMSRIEALSSAIEGLRKVAFSYNGGMRTADPYELGRTAAGTALLRGYQTGGFSLRGQATGWKLFRVAGISSLEVQAATFSPRASYFSLPSFWTKDLINWVA